MVPKAFQQVVVIPRRQFDFARAIGALLCSCLFISAGMGCFYAAWKWQDAEKPTLSLICFGLGMISSSVAIIVLELVFPYSKVKLFVDEGVLHYRRTLGPFFWRRQWPVDAVLGTSLRSFMPCGTEDQLSQMVLEFANGRWLALTELRPTDQLRAVDAAIKRLLNTLSPPGSDPPPLGCGMRVQEDAQQLRIVADKYSPWRTPQYDYLTACVFCCAGIVVGLIYYFDFSDSRLPGRNEHVLGLMIVIALVITFTGGGGWLCWKMREVTSRVYELTLNHSGVTVTQTSGLQQRTAQRQLGNLTEVREIVEMKGGPEDGESYPTWVRLQLISSADPPVDVLFGRPIEETEWMLRTLRRVLFNKEMPAPSQSQAERELR